MKESREHHTPIVFEERKCTIANQSPLVLETESGYKHREQQLMKARI